jgi:hypothetical protein
MATSFQGQIRDAAQLNQIMKSIGAATTSWAGSLSSALKSISEVGSESTDHVKQLEEAQGKILEQLGEEESKRKSIDRLMDAAGKKRLSFLEQYKQKWGTIEKETDRIGKKMIAHFGVSLVTAAQKATEKMKKLFSLSGLWGVFKKGVAIATLALGSIVAIAKQVGQAIVKHVIGGFRLAASVVKGSAGLIVSFFKKIWETITMGGGEIRAAVAEMAQAFGMFNREAGAAMNFLQANRRDWYQMGLSVGEAAKYVEALNLAYGHLIGFGNQAKKFYIENIKMSRALGLEAEAAAKLSKSLGESNKTLKTFAFSLVGTFGPGGPLQSMGVIIPQVARDVSESVEQFAFMSEQGKETFVAGAVWVRQYGFAIKDLTGIMDKFDTLSTAAENVSKLNQMFGVTINAMDMLVETDPAARLEKIQKQLLGAGKSWETMDYFQKKSLASMMGITGEQAQLVFSGKQMGKSRQDIARAMESEDKKQEDSKKRQSEVMGAILTQLKASRGIMGSILPIFYRLWVAFGKMFKTFLWGLRRGALNFVEGWAKGIRKLAEDPTWKKMSKDWSLRWQDTMKNFGIEWGKMWEQVDMKQFGQDFYGTIDEAVKAIKQILADLFPDWAASSKKGAGAINDIIHGIAMRLQGIIKWVGKNGANIIKDIGKVAKGVWHIVEKVFNFFDKSNWGAAADIMKNLFGTITKDAAKIFGYVDGVTGKMLKGFDPAVAAAEFVQSAYLKIRDIIIDIAGWWKKNGDDIKDTMKTVLGVTMEIGKQAMNMLKPIIKFVSEHPALIAVLAGVKVASSISKGLFGVGLGQMAGAGGGGVGGAVMSGAGRGLAGGAAGYGLGSAIGGGAGGAMGAGIGAGAGIGSVIPGVGTALGAGIGGIIGGIVGIVGMIEDEFADEAKKRKAIADSYVDDFNKYAKASNEQISIILESKSEFELLNEQMSKINENTSAHITLLESQMVAQDELFKLEKERRSLSAKTLKEDMRKEKDPKRKEDMRRQLRNLNLEMTRRDTVNKELEKSAENMAIISKLQEGDINQKILENQLNLARAQYEAALKAAEDKKKELAGGAETRVALAMPDAFATSKLLGGGVDYSVVVPELAKEFRASVAKMQLDPAIAKQLGGQAIQAQKDAMAVAASQSLNWEDKQNAIKKIFDDLSGSISAQAQDAIDKGKFTEAMSLQQDLSLLQGDVENKNMKLLNYRLALTEVEAKRREILANADAAAARGDTAAAAAAKAQLAGLATPPSPLSFGGLVTKATRALVGEAGPELVMPLKRGPVSRSTGAESMIQDYLGRMTGEKSGGGGKKETLVSMPVIINLDGRKVGEALVRTAVRSVA